MMTIHFFGAAFRRWALLCLGTLLFLAAGFSPAAASADREVRDVISQSMEALWEGNDFEADLKTKQQQLKNMMASGDVGSAGLKAAMQETITALMESRPTSRYYLQEMPEAVNDLFSPHLNWEAVKKMLWEEMASKVTDGRQMVFRVGTLAPQGTPWLNVPEKMLIPRMEELSDGRITLKLYGGGIMGEDEDILRKIDVGQLDVCGATTLGMLAASPEAAVFLLPGLFNNYEEIDYIYKKFKRRINEGFLKRGYILAALIDTGNFHIYSRHRISSLADIRKRKVLTCWGTVEKTVFDELGISTIPVAVPEVMSALSTGLADTNLAPAAWMLGMQAYQFANYYLEPPLLYSPAVVLLGVRAKERMQKQFGMSDVFTENVQELLVYEVNLFEGEWRNQIRTYEKRALHAFETKTGMQSVSLSAEDRQELEQAALRVREKLAGREFPEDLMNDVLKALEEFRADRP